MRWSGRDCSISLYWRVGAYRAQSPALWQRLSHRQLRRKDSDWWILHLIWRWSYSSFHVSSLSWLWAKVQPSFGPVNVTVLHIRRNPLSKIVVLLPCVMGVHRVALNAFLQVQPACKHPSVNLTSRQPVHKLWALFFVLVLHLTLSV